MNDNFTAMDWLLVFIFALSLSTFTDWYEQNNGVIATKDIVSNELSVHYINDDVQGEFIYYCKENDYILVDFHLDGPNEDISRKQLQRTFQMLSNFCK